MSCFKHSRRNDKHYVTCEPCSKFPNLVKQFLTSQNKKLTAIVQDSGTVYREETIEVHVKSQYHYEAIKKLRLDSVTIPKKLSLLKLVCLFRNKMKSWQIKLAS